MVLVFEDDARAFDPLSFVHENQRDVPSSAGLQLVRGLPDEVAYARVGGRSRVTLVFARRGVE